MTHRLADGVLEVRTTIENLCQESMPLCIGFHPVVSNSELSSRQVEGAHSRADALHAIEQGDPDRRHEPARLPDPLPLDGRRIDDVFGDVNHSDEFWVEGDGCRVSVRFGPKFPIAIVYAPEKDNVVCFEPMTAVTNAFNLAHLGLYRDLPVIGPGENWTESFWIRPTGF